MVNTGARLWWRVSTISMFGPLSPSPTPHYHHHPLPPPWRRYIWKRGGGGYLTLKLLYTKLASWGFNASSQTATTCTYCSRVGYHLLLNSLSWFPISSCPKVKVTHNTCSLHLVSNFQNSTKHTKPSIENSTSLW